MANIFTSAFVVLLFSFVISSVADLSLSTPQEHRSFKIQDIKVTLSFSFVSLPSFSL
jgi:hypothetical protein